MAEQPYEPIPNVFTNKRIPTLPTHINADKVNVNFNKLAEGVSIKDEKVTIRMISPELKDLIEYGIKGAVLNYSALPLANAVENGTIYITQEDEGANESGLYQSNGIDTWTFLHKFYDNFLELKDTPSSYTGQTLKIPRVNAGETAMEFIAQIKTFLALTDAPASFTGQTLKSVRVNAGETALEFYTPASGGSGGSDGISFFLRGACYVGNAQTMIPIPKGRTITKIIARVLTAPTGLALTLNLQKNGANDILTSDLSISAGTNTATSTSLSATYKVLAENDYVTLDINQVGSTIAGADLMVALIF